MRPFWLIRTEMETGLFDTVEVFLTAKFKVEPGETEASLSEL